MFLYFETSVLYLNFRRMKTFNILLIDNDMISHIVLPKLLDGKNVTIVHAQDGLEAVDLMGQNPCVDLVVTELMLPYKDGFTVLREIRSLYSLMPVIALIACVNFDVICKCYYEGFNDIIELPLNSDISKIEKYINLTNKSGETEIDTV